MGQLDGRVAIADTGNGEPIRGLLQQNENAINIVEIAATDGS